MTPDPTNQRILALLAANARTSTADIARHVCLSRTAVQARILSMEKDGIIEGYHASINERTPLLQALLFITLAHRPCTPALSWITEQEGVTKVFSLSGPIDAVAQICLPSTHALSRLNDLMRASPFISGCTSQIILQTQT